MGKIKPSLLAIINSLVLFLIIIFIIFSFIEKKDSTLVYIDNVVVFSNFNLAKDLNKLQQNEISAQKKIVDSLVSILQVVTSQDLKDNLQSQFVIENNKLREMADYFSNDASQKVWSRLNEYVKAFGKENEYEIILGTQGNGNIMYATDALDRTTEFLEYANKKYDGE